MAGFGRYKLTDALPTPSTPDKSVPSLGRDQVSSAGRKAKNKAAGRKGKPSSASELFAEQVREARESNQAKNAEASARDRMIDIGRGNQQAGRQRAK
jgi:hypothetical protein